MKIASYRKGANLAYFDDFNLQIISILGLKIQKIPNGQTKTNVMD
jgi:hypothetical protein